MGIKWGGDLALFVQSAHLTGQRPRSNERLFLGFLSNGHACTCLGGEALGNLHVVSIGNHG